MVAENANLPAKRKGSSSRPGDSPRAIIPLPAKLKIRNLYLIQGLGGTEIAHQTGLNLKTVYAFIGRAGLNKIRQENERKRIARSEVREAETLDEVSAAIAAESEEIALSAMQNTRDTLRRGDEYAARDFQSFTGGIKNLVQASRLVRGKDANGSGEGNSLAIFLVRGERDQRFMREAPAVQAIGAAQTVQPIIDIASAQQPEPSLPQLTK